MVIDMNKLLEKPLRNKKNLVIVTRKSPLAMWQSLYTKSKINEEYPQISVTIAPITTSGDKLKGKLTALGGKGLFVKELQQAIIEKNADIAVHSMKDVPNFLPQETHIVAMLRREDAADVLVTINGKSINELPINSIVGTSSIRRKVQILGLRSDLIVTELRGNVGTRLKKLETGKYDAIILAKAGLKRLGCLDSKKYKISEITEMIPAAGQGAIGIESLSDNTWVNELCSKLNCKNTYECVSEEREIVKRLGGDCGSPIAAFAKQINKKIIMEALVSNIEGTRSIRTVANLPINCSLKIGKKVANTLIKLGARKMITVSNSRE